MAGQPIVLYRGAGVHQCRAKYFARISFSQKVQFLRTFGKAQLGPDHSDDPLGLALAMGTHRRPGDTPSLPDLRSGFANQPQKLVLKALLPKVLAAPNRLHRLRVDLSTLVFRPRLQLGNDRCGKL